MAAKQATQSSTVVVHDCPLSNIDARALELHDYQTYATFHNTLMEQDVTALAQSMPMTLYFAILDSQVLTLYSYPYHDTHQMDSSLHLWF